MARFRYVALDRAGKTIAGELAAEDVDEVKRRLRDMGYFPSSITEGAQALVLRPAKARGGRRPSASDIVVMTRQLADMTAARLPMYRSLSVLVDQADRPAMRQMIETVRTDVQEGRPLSEALQRHPRYFPDLFINMVRAGETSGHLDSVLLRLAEFLEKSQRRRSQVVSALMYPAVLITVAVGAVFFIVGFLIPKLATLFEELKQSLPLITRILLGVATIVSATWWALALLIIGLIIFFRWYSRTERGREAIDLWMLKAPLLGPSLHKMAVSRFARTLGTMMGGGVPILNALEISGNAVGNRPLVRSAETVREDVRQGSTLGNALERTGLYPSLMVHMTAVGEETGQLPEMMMRVADSLDFEVDSTLGRLTTLLEPFIIIVMGFIVGFIVLAVLLPIFTLNATISR